MMYIVGQVAHMLLLYIHCILPIRDTILNPIYIYKGQNFLPQMTIFPILLVYFEPPRRGHLPIKGNNVVR